MFVYWQNAICLLLPAIHAFRFEVHENTTLENIDIKELSPIGIRLCVKECVKLESCKSAKFRKMTLTCTLLSSTHLETQTIISAGTSYISIDKGNDNPCSSCEEHETCETVKTGMSKCIKTDKACNNGWRQLNNKCYKSVNIRATLQSARETCRKMGKNVIVAEPRSQEENNIIKETASSNDAWIGVSDLITEGVWLFFSDNSQVTWTNWSPGQPTNYSNKNCTVIYNGKWYDWQCDYPYVSVCQYNLI